MGWGRAREAQEVGDLYTVRTDLHCYTAEINVLITLKSNFLQVKFFLSQGITRKCSLKKNQMQKTSRGDSGTTDPFPPTPNAQRRLGTLWSQER